MSIALASRLRSCSSVTSESLNGSECIEYKEVLVRAALCMAKSSNVHRNVNY